LNDELTVGFVGRLCPQKNLGILLDAFSSLHEDTKANPKLVIVGDGPERSALAREAKRRGVDKQVVFTGAVSEGTKVKLLKSFDIFVLPSLYEGCPIALLEAMASAKAIISSDIPSVRQIVKHNEEAILVNPYDAQKLKKAILLLLNNAPLRTILGSKARKRAELYDTGAIFRRLLRIYEKLIRREDHAHLQEWNCHRHKSAGS